MAKAAIIDEMADEIGSRLLDVLVQMWAPGEERRTKLGMVAACMRQFEAWWKFEIATAWEQQRVLAGEEWEDVWCWLECHERADVLIARAPAAQDKYDDTRVLIPLELKTTGTWWGSGNRTKALGGLKRDLSDLFESPGASPRPARPFGAVAILITHVEWDAKPGAPPNPVGPPIADFQALVEEARKIGAGFQNEGVELARDTLIHAGRVGTGSPRSFAANGTAMARQLVWTRRT